MKRIIQFLLLLGLMTSSHGREISIPPGYLANRSVDERCGLLKLPKEIVNAEICIYDSSLEQVAFQSGLFENEQGRWVLSGPGVPNLPTIKKEKKIISMYGVAMCAIEDGAGLHGAGGKCFYGISSIEDRSLILRSAPIPSNAWNVKNLIAHKNMMNAFTKLNLENDVPKIGASKK